MASENNLQNKYNKLVAHGVIKDDSAQRQILNQLDQLKNLLEENTGSRKLLKIVPLSAKNTIKGLYIYGEVGRGKSMLMDLFFNALATKKKQRVHFHAFMLDVHAKMHKWRGANKNNPDAADPIPPLAKSIAKSAQVLCFDELQVTDIADAMILGRLFTELFKNGIVVVATSNRHPDELYKDGLQRERFLPFIELIKEKMEVYSLAAEQDYRLAHLKSLSKVYYYPLDKKAHYFMEEAFAGLTNNAKPAPAHLHINGRKLTIARTHNDIAWASFHELCEKALGATDYIEIAREFNTLLLENIPQMGKENRNEAKRFVTLIDELYEHKVKLICTAANSPDELYKAGDGSFEFQRTVSRLIEMQSEQYLTLTHLG